MFNPNVNNIMKTANDVTQTLQNNPKNSGKIAGYDVKNLTDELSSLKNALDGNQQSLKCIKTCTEKVLAAVKNHQINEADSKAILDRIKNARISVFTKHKLDGESGKGKLLRKLRSVCTFRFKKGSRYEAVRTLRKAERMINKQVKNKDIEKMKTAEKQGKAGRYAKNLKNALEENWSQLQKSICEKLLYNPNVSIKEVLKEKEFKDLKKCYNQFSKIAGSLSQKDKEKLALSDIQAQFFNGDQQLTPEKHVDCQAVSQLQTEWQQKLKDQQTMIVKKQEALSNAETKVRIKTEALKMKYKTLAEYTQKLEEAEEEARKNQLMDHTGQSSSLSVKENLLKDKRISNKRKEELRSEIKELKGEEKQKNNVKKGKIRDTDSIIKYREKIKKMESQIQSFEVAKDELLVSNEKEKEELVKLKEETEILSTKLNSLKALVIPSKDTNTSSYIVEDGTKSSQDEETAELSISDQPHFQFDESSELNTASIINENNNSKHVMEEVSESNFSFSKFYDEEQVKKHYLTLIERQRDPNRSSQTNERKKKKAAKAVEFLNKFRKSKSTEEALKLLEDAFAESSRINAIRFSEDSRATLDQYQKAYCEIVEIVQSDQDFTES